jgi:hypothetical protein
VIQKVKGAAGNKITHVLDAVAGNDTQVASVKVIAEGKPGKVTIVLPHVEGVHDVRKDVQVTSSYSTLPPLRMTDQLSLSVTVISVFTSYGFEYGGKGPDEGDRRLLSAFLQRVPELIKDGKVKHIPVKKFDGGLEKVVSDGFEYIATGKVSAEKIVFTV